MIHWVSFLLSSEDSSCTSINLKNANSDIKDCNINPKREF